MGPCRVVEQQQRLPLLGPFCKEGGWCRMPGRRDLAALCSRSPLIRSWLRPTQRPQLGSPCARGWGCFATRDGSLWVVARPSPPSPGGGSCSHHDVPSNLHRPCSPCGEGGLGEEAPGLLSVLPPADRAGEGCTWWGSAPSSPASTNPATIHSHGCQLRGWRATTPGGCRGRGEMHSPVAGDPTLQRGSEHS